MKEISEGYKVSNIQISGGQVHRNEKDVTKIIGCYIFVDKLNISGISTNDKASELYKQRNPKTKDFSFMACYYVLRDPQVGSRPRSNSKA